jgi:malonate decarboxylase epsilon subunit
VSIAFLFPGQGSQYVGFLHQLPKHPVIQDTLAEAESYFSQPILNLDTEESLRSTVGVQLSLYVAGVAAARALQAEGIAPDFVAGLSVGAFAAAVICESLSFADGWKLVRQRAEAMEALYPEGYGLSVIVGLQERQVAELIAKYSSPETPVYMGNINAPLQIVIAGSDAGMDKVLAAAREKAVRRAERLHVSVPSHCALLSPVARELEKSLSSMELHVPTIPDVSKRRARPLRKLDLIRDDLATNIENPVRWHDATNVLVELGTELFLEMPPGKILASLIKDSFSNVHSVSVDGTSFPYIQRQVQELGVDNPAQ